MTKKLLLIILMAVGAMTASAKKYVPGEPFRKNGYHITSIPSKYSHLWIRKFSDADSLYYIRVGGNGGNVDFLKYDEFQFLVVNKEVVDSMLAYLLTDIYLPKWKQKIQWLEEFFKATGIELPADQTEWTLWKPKQEFVPTNKRVNMMPEKRWIPFNTRTAWQAYCDQRGLDKYGNKKQEITDRQFMSFLSVFMQVLPLVGGGGDTRTLYDKIMQDGGY